MRIGIHTRTFSFGAMAPVEVDVQMPEGLQAKIEKARMKRSQRLGIDCNRLFFGLGQLQNLLRKPPRPFGAGSNDAELEADILAFLNEKFHGDYPFSSIVVNKFCQAEDMMPVHTDRNIPAFRKQVVLRWGEADGARLKVGEDEFDSGCWIVDGNFPHSVTSLQSGCRFSLVTYAKQTSVNNCPRATMTQLAEKGYPCAELILFCKA